uniref:Uncharacterized protein n=1 Tax=Arundo donax TaxID=35708 RepID=A0A0A9BLP4_ARUDO
MIVLRLHVDYVIVLYLRFKSHITFS